MLQDPTVVFVAFKYPSITGTDQARAMQLLSQLPNPAAVRDEDGCSLLYLACQNKWGDVAKMLLEMAHSDSALTICLQFQYPSTTGTDQAHALQLLSELPNPPTVRDKDGRTLLHWACSNEWKDVAIMLMEKHIQCQALEPVIFLVFEYPSTTGTDQAHALELLSQLPCAAAMRDRGWSLLHYALENEWNDVAEVLMKMESPSALEAIAVEVFVHPSTKDSGINQAHALQLLSHLHNPGDVRDKIGNSLLQWACNNGWYNVVKELVEKFHCNPNYQVRLVLDREDMESPSYMYGLVQMKRNQAEFGTAVHFASRAGYLGIVKYLVKQGGDPECGGVTPLHLACMKGHLDIVKFLVTECHCNPLLPITMRPNGMDFGITPLYHACEEGHYNVVAFLLSSHAADRLMACNPSLIMRQLAKIEGGFFLKTEQFFSWHGMTDFFVNFLTCRRRSPFHPAFKVFVMGNPLAGKSTLVKAIQSRMTDTSLLGVLTAKFKKVSGAMLQTAGIIPVLIESQELGNIIMYDLAGQYQYYSSHAALLEKLVSSPGALLIVVVDLSKSKEEITQQLQYWSSFIENHCSHGSSKPAVVIIGSHADVAKAQKETPAKKLADILGNPSSSLQALDEIISLNCTQLASDGLMKVCNAISQHITQFQKNFDIDLQIHFLYDFLCSNFKDQTARKVSEIVTRIAEDESAEMKLGNDKTITLLPRDTPTLSKHLTTLCEKGQFLYLRNDQNVADSWVILNQEVLLSEVNGTIFAPENFKEHHDISSSTGVVPFSKIEHTFPSHSPEMIISFLSHLEFCQQIAESEASVISGDQLGGSQQSSETFYFFPALVSAERPEESCKSIERTHYKCGWILQCIRSNQFLSPWFLHVLLLRLAFSFALAPETAEEDKACPVLQRRCNVWKSGIHWQNRDGVEAIVEVVEQNTAVTVMMGCLEGREVECAGLRSKLIQDILATKERVCAAVELRESFIHPAELSSYPLKNSKLLPSFTITELATAIAEDKQVVTRKQGHGQQMLGISELLYFEPYTCFNATLLAEVFKDETSGKEVSDIFHLNAGKAAHSKMCILMKILEHNPSELQAAIAIATASQTYQNDPMHHCYLLFRTWALSSPSRTYQALRSALDRFSVFRGRNPLVSILCILYMRPVTLTLWPVHACSCRVPQIMTSLFASIANS